MRTLRCNKIKILCTSSFSLIRIRCSKKNSHRWRNISLARVYFQILFITSLEHLSKSFINYKARSLNIKTKNQNIEVVDNRWEHHLEKLRTKGGASVLIECLILLFDGFEYVMIKTVLFPSSSLNNMSKKFMKILEIGIRQPFYSRDLRG